MVLSVLRGRFEREPLRGGAASVANLIVPFGLIVSGILLWIDQTDKQQAS